MINLVENGFRIRQTQIEDYEDIRNVCLRVYQFAKPWNFEQIQSHIDVFPQGQIVLEDLSTNRVVGMAASLVVLWDDYENSDSWSRFTDRGTFINHDLDKGKTLYGAEVMIDPDFQGRGLGKFIYRARRKIVTDLKLLRIRAGARLRGYGTYAQELTPIQYITKVIDHELFDPTLSFQLKEGFKVISHVPDYLNNDPESLGHAVVIEWLNPEIALESNYQNQIEMLKKIINR